MEEEATKGREGYTDCLPNNSLTSELKQEAFKFQSYLALRQPGACFSDQLMWCTIFH